MWAKWSWSGYAAAGLPIVIDTFSNAGLASLMPSGFGNMSLMFGIFSWRKMRKWTSRMLYSWGEPCASCKMAWACAKRWVSEKILGSETGRISLLTAKSRISIGSPDSLFISPKYQWLIRERIANDLACERCRRAWMLENTFAPCSISAWVVPTGALELTSRIFSSDVVTTPLAASVSHPSSWKSTLEGWLNGKGIASLRTSSTPGAPSISRTCVGSILSLCPLMRPPLSLSIVWLLLIWAASSKARKAPVRAAESPPMRCGRPIA